jgi:hypothetical protein
MVGALLTNKFTTSGVAINRPRGADNKPTNETVVQKKLLICAPSNAAVDEIVQRLKVGVKTLRGEFHKINVIRLGRSDAIDANVKDVTLDELVRTKMEGDGKSGTLILSEREKLHQEAARLKEAVGTISQKLEEARAKGDTDLERRLQREWDGKKRDQSRIGALIDENKSNGNTASRENEITRRRLQQEIIDGAHVLCSTLSGSGHEMFKNLSVEFETVIIDEAAQCIELSALIPLKYGCSKCILVGDPKQLPPTVLSRSAARYGYEQSLFVRMQKNHPKDVHLLDTQYRMHPEISIFPSKQFYDGKLIDGGNMAVERKKPWHASPLLGPYRFFDVAGTQSTGARGHSYINKDEIKVALRLYERLRTDYSSYDFRSKIGIITPYKAQLKELRSTFLQTYGEKVFDEIEFNTTDAFQGRESEVIIFSCVRARASGGIGFLDDIRRMNVGLTRAKSSLWVLGDSKSLMQGEFWAKLIEDARHRQKYTEGAITDLLSKPSSFVKSEATLASLEPLHPDSMDDSRRNSIESVEMTDAPNIVDERRASSVSIETILKGRPPKPPMGRFLPKTITAEERAQRLTQLSAQRAIQLEEKARFQAEIDALEPKSDVNPKMIKDLDLTALEDTWYDGKDIWTKIKPGIYQRPNGRLAPGHGFDSRYSCGFCGDTSHLQAECGDLAAINSHGRLCKRCLRPPAHMSVNCSAPRCLRCGALGHEEKHCTGFPMSDPHRQNVLQQDRDQQRKAEADRNRAQQRRRLTTKSTVSDNNLMRNVLASGGDGSRNDPRLNDLRDPYTDLKEPSKRQRAISPPDEDGPAKKKVSSQHIRSNNRIGTKSR